MSTTLTRIQDLAARGEIRVSAHGYDELAADGILATDAITGLSRALIVEDYPTYSKGPAVLVLVRTRQGCRSTLCGVFPRGRIHPGFWSPRTGRTRRSGIQRSAGGRHEREGYDETRAGR